MSQYPQQSEDQEHHDAVWVENFMQGDYLTLSAADWFVESSIVASFNYLRSVLHIQWLPSFYSFSSWTLPSLLLDLPLLLFLLYCFSITPTSINIALSWSSDCCGWFVLHFSSYILNILLILMGGSGRFNYSTQ